MAIASHQLNRRRPIPDLVQGCWTYYKTQLNLKDFSLVNQNLYVLQQLRGQRALLDI